MDRHYLKDALLREMPNGKLAPVRLEFLSPPIFNPELVEKVIDELSIKEMMVKLHMDEFTGTEKLVYRLLYESGVAAGRLSEITQKECP
jgi:hypothetical protein